MHENLASMILFGKERDKEVLTLS